MHVVLVLAHADRLGIDLHQLGERVLQPPPDRDRAAHGQVKVRELLARHLAGGIDARARLAHGDDNHILLAHQLQHVARERLCLAPGRAVAHGDRLGLVLLHERGEGRLRLGRALHRVDHRVREELASGVQHRHLAASADAGIDGQNALLAKRRGEQQVAQVLREHLHRRPVR